MNSRLLFIVVVACVLLEQCTAALSAGQQKKAEDLANSMSEYAMETYNNMMMRSGMSEFMETMQKSGSTYKYMNDMIKGMATKGMEFSNNAGDKGQQMMMGAMQLMDEFNQQAGK